LNLANARPSPGQHQTPQPTKKAALLVPYDKDSDDDTENDELPSAKTNGLSASLHRVNPKPQLSQASTENSIPCKIGAIKRKESTNGKDSPNDSENESDKSKEESSRVKSRSSSNNDSSNRPNSCGNASLHKNSEATKEPPIPILKVKATTNSWQVVETTPSVNVKEHASAQSNWKISKSSDSGHVVEKMSLSSAPSLSHKESNDSDKSESMHIEKKDKDKKKKKKRKKDKDRQRKRDRENESDDEAELKWVERTKETLELENKTHHSNGLNSN